MAELGQDPALNAPADPPDRAAGSAVPDPRDARIAELEAYAANAQATFGTLKAYEDDIKAIVEGDEPRLLQLVRNLLDNATRHATSRVDVRLSSAGSDVLLDVEDDGPGVDPELRPRLFERFAKGTNSPGSGLGLAICRWIADAHGGAISFSGGSRFAVQLRRYP